MRLLLLLVAVAGCVAASAATMHDTSAAAAPAAVCVLDIRGAPGRSGIARAAIECSGGPVTLGVHQALLGKFTPSWAGVRLDTGCGLPGCLLSICGTSRITISDSVVTGVTGLDQSASPSLVCTLESSMLELRSTQLSSSAARGLRAANASRVTIADSAIAGNKCECSGAGVGASDNARLLVTGASTIIGNTAVNATGGGLVAGDSANATIAGNAVVANNTAVNATGGGLVAGDSANVTITGNAVVANNTAVNASGGGLVAGSSTNVTVTGNAVVANNTAVNASGGGLLAGGSANVTVTGNAVVANNTAVNHNGGGLVAGGSANVTIAGNAVVANNTAVNASGGGLVAVGGANVTITGNAVVAYNTAVTYSGGGLVAGDSANVTITGNAVFANNTAVNGSGGGLVAGDSANVTITGNAVVANNTSHGFEGGGLAIIGAASLLVTGASRVVGNTARGAAGGGLAAYDTSRVSIVGSSVVANNTATRASGGGAAVFGAAQLAVGGDALFLRNSVDVNYSGPDIYAEGTSGLRFGLPGSASQGSGRLTKCSDGVLWERRPGAGGNVAACEVGEVAQRRLCVCCPIGMFSLNASATACEPCPAHATCSEGACITPDAEFWHSEPRSAQIHRCPNPGACLTGGKCAREYTGPLCGACRPGFGVTTPFQCSRCVSARQQLAIYACATLALVLAIAATVHFTWADNLSQDAAVRASDLIKVLVQFLQYLVIVGSVSAPWPPFLRTLFRLSSVVFAASSGQVVSLDCLLSQSVGRGSLPPAIQRQLFYLLAPLFVAAAVVCVQALAWALRQCAQRMGWARCGRDRSNAGAVRVAPAGGSTTRPLLLRQLPVTLLVVFYYAYPTLTKASLAFFACLTIDTSAGPHPQHAPLDAAHGYWVSDVRQACFVGWHRPWALGLGLPCVLLLCLGVPLGMWWLLWANRARAGEPRFREHFGFLYRNFRAERVWWEAVWAAQTVLLTAIAAFHFSLGAFYSMLALQLVFVASAAAQVVFRPYASQRLHVLHASGTACLLFVSWGALVLFNVDAKRGTWQGVAVGVLMLCLSAAFAGVCVVCIVAAATSALRRLPAQLARWCPGRCCACLAEPGGKGGGLQS